MWSGDCVDGFAEGTGVAASFLAGEPDDRYEGHLRRGKAEGYGVMTWPTGARYEGAWAKGERNGHGTLTWEDGSRYIGD